jgi:CRISPR-associated protein Csd2
MAARKLIIFKHDSKLGCCQSHVLFDKIKVEKTTENSLHVHIKIISNDERDVPAGVEILKNYE